MNIFYKIILNITTPSLEHFRLRMETLIQWAIPINLHCRWMHMTGSNVSTIMGRRYCKINKQGRPLERKCCSQCSYRNYRQRMLWCQHGSPVWHLGFSVLFFLFVSFPWSTHQGSLTQMQTSFISRLNAFSWHSNVKVYYLPDVNIDRF